MKGEVSPLRYLLMLCILFPLALWGQGLQTPSQYLPHKLGEQFTEHYMLTDYIEHVAKTSPQTMLLARYGTTYQDRPLQVAIFSAPKNMARLETLRLQHLQRLGFAPKNAAKLPQSQENIAIVWLSMSVHGNEPSGSECSLELAYRLATQTDANIKAWLENTIVILDPSLNPDGYSRYTHWYRGVSSNDANPNLEVREHLEPWPGGRVNHYQFDLNRDWAWATQKETRQRLKVYHQWMPHIHADLHEQYIDNPYYFAPAAEPLHPIITPFQRNFQDSIGQNHARYFDANGWLYFTKEVFDLFYPSYGDTYPLFNGAIGMTYEQGGHSRAGRAALMSNGDTLFLNDRILHHLTTSLSTIEIGSTHAAELVKNMVDYFEHYSNNTVGKYSAFIIKKQNDQAKVKAFLDVLDLHHIDYGYVGGRVGSLKGYDFYTAKESTYTPDVEDIVVSCHQPHGAMVQALLEPEGKLSDTLTYDITAWSLLYSYGLDGFASYTTLQPTKPYSTKAASLAPIATKGVYAYCIARGALPLYELIADFTQEGLKVRYSTKPFEAEGKTFPEGTFVITWGDNKDHKAWQQIAAMATEKGISIDAITNSWMRKGPNFGSESMVLVENPTIAFVYDDEVNANSFGHTWYFLEQDLKVSASAIPLKRLSDYTLERYNVLVFPDGYYNLEDKTLNILRTWIQQGGKLIAFDGGAKAFADKDNYDLKIKTNTEEKDHPQTPLPYNEAERTALSKSMPGAILQVTLDKTHPINFGLPSPYYTLKTNTHIYQMNEGQNVAAWINKDYQKLGFVGSTLLPQLANSAAVVTQKIGQGKAIFFADNPLFRAFWYQGKLQFCNALFY